MTKSECHRPVYSHGTFTQLYRKPASLSDRHSRHQIRHSQPHYCHCLLFPAVRGSPLHLPSPGILPFRFSGSPFTAVFSLTGATASFLAMYISYRRNSFSPTGISIIGGVTHNLAQLLISALLLNTPAFLWYSPVLFLSGTVTGLINGLIATKIIHTVKGMKW